MSTVDTTYDDVTRSEAVPRDHARVLLPDP